MTDPQSFRVQYDICMCDPDFRCLVARRCAARRAYLRLGQEQLGVGRAGYSKFEALCQKLSARSFVVVAYSLGMDPAVLIVPLGEPWWPAGE